MVRSPRKVSLLFLAALGCAAVPYASIHAGEWAPSTPPPIQQPIEPIDLYEAGRGLITLEGPTGMFINPTSGTLPRNSFTAQYCFFTPNNDDSVIGHGGIISYGVTDWLELGIHGNYISIDGAEDLDNLGPLARVRLLTNDGIIPEFSIGSYARFGDEARESVAAFAAGYWRIPIDEDGFFKSVGFHGGVRHNWNEVGDDLLAGYAGAEVQLPYRLYLLGEIQTQDEEEEVPYAFGVQWRLFGINISVAGIQNGNLDDPGFYFGIGSAIQF